MGMMEQIVDDICPFMRQMVQIRIIYECSNTRLCQIDFEPAFCECSWSDFCPGYQQKDGGCLLMTNYAANYYGR